MRRPAMRASVSRRASAAGIAAFCGRPTPSASTIEAMLDAVPIVMQWPGLRFIAASASRNCACVSSPARTCSLMAITCVPEPISVPR